MADSKNTSIATATPEGVTESAEERIARLEAMVAESEAKRIAAEADAEALRAGGAKPAPEAFVPVVTYVMRPAGYDVNGRGFTLTTPQLEVSIQTSRNGKPRIVRERLVTWAALLAAADGLRDVVANGGEMADEADADA